VTLPAGIRIAWTAVPSGAPRREASRALLADLLPGAVFVSRCPSCGGDHGRIHTEGVDAAVSVSYVPGWTVVAVTHDHERVGVDAVPAHAAGLERVLAAGSDAGAWARFPDGAAARAWARVEAVLKADGRGLRVDPSRVSVRPRSDGWVARITEPDRAAPGTGRMTWRGWDLDGPPGIAVAVAVG
jgi:4'-phosphopantetheinyl transferase